MQVLVGTSGWIYKDWAKKFYPSALKHEYKLTYFSNHFPTVEINSTFYRLPGEAAVRNWYGSVPSDFVFSAKLSRYLTHRLQLKPGETFNTGLQNYLDRLQHLRDKLGPILVQLPASFHAAPDRIVNLAQQLKKIAPEYKLEVRLACEFRHKSWFTAEIMDILREHNIAAVIASGPGRWPETREVTAGFAFIRFHGDAKLYASSYTEKELDEWARFIKDKCQKCQAVYCYFNNDQSAKAVDNAKYLASKFSQ
jgi:uncharacterized protein YecE (DUF72 family)